MDQDKLENKDKAKGKALNNILMKILLVLGIPMFIGIGGILLVGVGFVSDKYDPYFGASLFLGLGLWGTFMGTVGVYASISSYVFAKKTNFMPFKGQFLAVLISASLSGVTAYFSHLLVLYNYEMFLSLF